MLIKDIYIFDGEVLRESNDLRIEGNTITAISNRLQAGPGEEVLEGSGRIAFPGMVDAHQHVWQGAFKSYASDMMLLQYLDDTLEGIGSKITAEDLYYLNLYGYLDAAAAGVTTVFDWCHVINSPEHADAALQAALDSGIQVLFFHALPAVDKNKWWNNSTAAHTHDIERVVNRYGTASPLVKIGMGMRGPEFAQMDVNRADTALARHLEIPVSMHIGCSILGKIHQPVLQLQQAGLLHNRMNMVHCNTLSAEEFDLMEAAGCLVTLTPEAEMQMGLGTPASAYIKNSPGLKWSVGTDVPTSCTSSMLFQTRLLLQHYRCVVNQQLIDAMEFPVTMPYKSNAFLFRSQQYAIPFAGFEKPTGISVGNAASFVLADWQDLQSGSFAQRPAFYYLQEAHFSTIISNGKLIKDNHEWQGHDMHKLQQKIQVIVKRLIG